MADQMAILEKIHEELVYAAESLAEDYTREARYTLQDIFKEGSSASELPEKLHFYIQKEVEYIVSGLMDKNRDARTRLVKLRRRVLNAILLLRGENSRVYSYVADINLLEL